MGGELGRRRHERRFLRAAESRAGESEEELSERSGLLTTGTGHFDKIIIGTNEMGNTGYASAWRRAHTKLRQAAHEEDERGVNFTMMEKKRHALRGTRAPSLEWTWTRCLSLFERYNVRQLGDVERLPRL